MGLSLWREGVPGQEPAIPGYIVSCAVGERTILLNLENERYLSLNRAGGWIFGALAEGADLWRAAVSLAQEFDVTMDRAWADTSAFAAALASAGCLKPYGDRPRSGRERSLSIPGESRMTAHRAADERRHGVRLSAEILLLYRQVRRSLAESGDLLSQLPQLDGAHGLDATPEAVRDRAVRLGRAVGSTLPLFPFGRRCLVRSLVLLRLLARDGIEATLVIGVGRDVEAFSAHAWVEHADTALLESGAGRFERLLELDTGRIGRASARV